MMNVLQILSLEVITVLLISAITSAVFSIVKSNMKNEYITLLSVDILLVAIWNISHTGIQEHCLL